MPKSSSSQGDVNENVVDRGDVEPGDVEDGRSGQKNQKRTVDMSGGVSTLKSIASDFPPGQLISGLKAGSGGGGGSGFSAS